MYARIYARGCCTCNKTVTTDKMILKGSGPTIYSSLITFIETHNCHRILHNQPGHLLPDHQHPVNQPARLLGQENMITVVPKLPGQSACKIIRIMNKLKFQLPQNILLTIYNSLILSQLNYCLLGWGYIYINFKNGPLELLIKVLGFHILIHYSKN